MNNRWFLAAIVALSLLSGNLPAAGVRDPRSMPSATSSARSLFANRANTQTAPAAAGWTAVTASLPPLQNIAAVAAGGYHTCALTTAGGIKCWGDNQYGQLGDGTTTDRSTPVDVVGLGSGVVAIGMGWKHTCALTTGRRVRCWGDNYFGQLGDGTTFRRSTPVDVVGLTSGVAAIDGGWAHNCILTTVGGVACWGTNAYGQLGNGSTTQSSTPVTVVGLGSGVAAITAGGYHSCAVTAAGAAKCWGYNLSGQLGDGTATDRNVPVDVVGLGSGAAAIGAGDDHTCALTTSDAAKCWGDNWYGQLGDGTTFARSTPVDVVGLAGGAAIAAGGHHTCALLTVGGVECWGENWRGQLGDGTITNRSIPVAVAGLANAAAIVAGGGHTCALAATGGVKCWGANWNGQLGDGMATQRSTPANVAGLESGVAAIAAGERHTCAVTTAGAAKCWGNNGYNQLGDGTWISNSTPVDVAGLGNGVAAVAAGEGHTCVLLMDGGAKCWGDNWYGQLGDGTTTDRSTPVDVVGLANGAAAIVAGSIHTCAVTAASGAKCWGANWNGQLGDGTTYQRSIPVDVAGLESGVAALAAGWGHTCALTTAGGVKCWGYNRFGQLGDGTTTSSSTPVDVVGLGSGAVAIAVGDGHTCAVTIAGGVKCWGDNLNGQLGDGTTANRSTPVDVVGLASEMAATAAGHWHTCALTAAGGAKCWGRNASGQLGDGTTFQRSMPVDVAGLGSGAAVIAAGYGHTCALTMAGGVKCWGSDETGQLGVGTTLFSTTPVDVVMLLRFYLPVVLTGW